MLREESFVLKRWELAVGTARFALKTGRNMLIRYLGGYDPLEVVYLMHCARRYMLTRQSEIWEPMIKATIYKLDPELARLYGFAPRGE